VCVRDESPIELPLNADEPGELRITLSHGSLPPSYENIVKVSSTLLQIHGSRKPDMITAALPGDTNARSIYMYKSTDRSDLDKTNSLPLEPPAVRSFEMKLGKIPRPNFFQYANLSMD
jgi:hypothetical protein